MTATREREYFRTREVAELLGISHTNVSRVAGLPQPVAKAGNGPGATRLWDPAEIRRFAKQYHKRREERSK